MPFIPFPVILYPHGFLPHSEHSIHIGVGLSLLSYFPSRNENLCIYCQFLVTCCLLLEKQLSEGFELFISGLLGH